MNNSQTTRSAYERRRSGRRRGSAFVLILGASLMLMVIAMGGLLVGRTAIRSANASTMRSQSHFLAQSGVELALQEIQDDTGWRINADTSTLFERTVNAQEKISAYLSDPEGDALSWDVCGAVMLEIVAVSGDAQQIIEVELESDAIGYDPLEEVTSELKPIAWWRLSDTEDEAVDKMELQAGKYLGTITKEQPVPFRCDRSVWFDGSSGRITIPHNEKFQLSSGSVSFWFIPDRTTATQGLFSKHIGDMNPGKEGFICWASANRIYFTVRNKMTNTMFAGIIPPADFTSQWHHVVLSFGQPDGAMLFVDGVRVGWHYGMDSGWWDDGWGSQNDADIRLGMFPDLTNNRDGYMYPLQGKMDEVALFDYQLSEDEVKKLYDAGTQIIHTMHVLDGSWRQLVE